jgi:hypothetical protein
MTIFQDLQKFHSQVKPQIEEADLTDVKESLREIHKIQRDLSRRYADITTFIHKRDRLSRPSKILTAIAKEKEKEQDG